MEISKRHIDLIIEALDYYRTSVKSWSDRQLKFDQLPAFVGCAVESKTEQISSLLEMVQEVANRE